MRHAVTAVALALAMMSGTAARAEPGDPMIGAFAQDAALSNEFEIAESKVVLDNSTDPTLRAFAQDMIEDHGNAQRMLAQAGRRAGVTTAFVFDIGRKKLVDTIGLMEGAPLRETYLRDQVLAHASAVTTLADYAMTGTDPALRAYAREALPVVREHQRMLEEITGQRAPL